MCIQYFREIISMDHLFLFRPTRLILRSVFFNHFQVEDETLLSVFRNLDTQNSANLRIFTELSKA